MEQMATNLRVLLRFLAQLKHEGDVLQMNKTDEDLPGKLALAERKAEKLEREYKISATSLSFLEKVHSELAAERRQYQTRCKELEAQIAELEAGRAASIAAAEEAIVARKAAVKAARAADAAAAAAAEEAAIPAPDCGRVMIILFL